jgi:hypothetical protein
MRLLWCFFFFILSPVRAQFTNFFTQSELGIMAGGSSYIGDINPYNPFYTPKPALGLIYRFTINNRFCFRANVLYGEVQGSDADSKNELQLNRNLSFKSPILEGAAGIEFSYFPFQLGNKRHGATAYLLAELGVFHMNPMAEYEEEWYELQPLGTEGQGTSLSDKNPYKLTQFCIPLGVGFKASVGRRCSFSMEFGIRKTFTDYLDDIGSENYVDPFQLAFENGPYAGALSNRSLNNTRYGRRGVSFTKDWYTFFGGMVAFKLGKKKGCYFKN